MCAIYGVELIIFYALFLLNSHPLHLYSCHCTFVIYVYPIKELSIYM